MSRFIHGEAPRLGKPQSPEYKAYVEAKARCQSPKHRQRLDYGGRGIEFRFTSYLEFLLHLGRRPSKEYSLDRINNAGHYELGNVRWATETEQQNNKRSNHFISINGQSRTVAQWARIYNCRTSRIFMRIHYGYCEMCAVALPKGSKCMHRGKH